MPWVPGSVANPVQMMSRILRSTAMLSFITETTFTVLFEDPAVLKKLTAFLASTPPALTRNHSDHITEPPTHGRACMTPRHYNVRPQFKVLIAFNSNVFSPVQCHMAQI